MLINKNHICNIYIVGLEIKSVVQKILVQCSHLSLSDDGPVLQHA